MRNFLAALIGAFVASAVVVAVAVAVPRLAQHNTSVSGMPMGGAMGSTMMGSVATPAARKLTIVHVQRGCHVWSNGTTTATMMRLHLTRGQHLQIMDMDVDAHQMMEFGGPAHMRMGGPMMMNRGMTLSFPRAGVYHLGMKTVEMPGMASMDVKTIGPDNKLRLVVTVA